MPKSGGAKGIGPIAVPKENHNQPPALADIGKRRGAAINRFRLGTDLGALGLLLTITLDQ
jgi:hypothetical protein